MELGGGLSAGAGEFPIQDSRRDHRRLARPGEIVPPMVAMTSGRDATPNADKSPIGQPARREEGRTGAGVAVGERAVDMGNPSVNRPGGHQADCGAQEVLVPKCQLGFSPAKQVKDVLAS